MCTVSYYPYFCLFAFIFNSTANTHIYSYIHTLSLLYALPIYFCTRAPLSSFWTRSGGLRSHMPANRHRRERHGPCARRAGARTVPLTSMRSEEHTSELQSLMRISYAVFCLKKKNKPKTQ